jgi:hypothetical protein
MKYSLIVVLCFIFLGCLAKGENNMFSGKKVEKIIQNEQNPISEIDNVLSPIFYKNPEKLTFCEKNIVYVEELEREVNNGGFNQYFFNSSGDYVNETVAALETIGSKIFLRILKDAINKFPNGIVPNDREERQDILLEIDEDNELWQELDNEFYKYEEDINDLLIDYIKNNIGEFR